MYTLEKNNTSPLCILCTLMPEIKPLSKFMLVWTWYEESTSRIHMPPLTCLKRSLRNFESSNLALVLLVPTSGAFQHCLTCHKCSSILISFFVVISHFEHTQLLKPSRAQEGLLQLLKVSTLDEVWKFKLAASHLLVVKILRYLTGDRLFRNVKSSTSHFVGPPKS